MTIKITNGETPESQAFVHSFQRTNWDCDKFKTRYRNNLMELLKDVPIQDVRDIKTVPEAKVYVNDVSQKLAEIMHQSCEKSEMQNPEQNVRKYQNSWWSEDCTLAKQKNKFWFTIWCKNGRPREGHVYACYKKAKYKYRKICRQAVNKSSRHKYNLISHLRSASNKKQFWNRINKLRKAPQYKSGITLNTLTDHFKNKFSQMETNVDNILKANTMLKPNIMLLKIIFYQTLHVAYFR